ncbi:glycosyltransferase involved in cell wall biosynthesis [Rhodothalassium salexigens DSM 2132]|uniref:Glycosyltransferase involved in cell wall biosynthesis n=1 Tax=Rhodothalassium salexigens DSM 2132 TaxID=1188247 RepID=A0A4R2PI68_RHOSA|nr:glycosyltransferase [Rhodothalassium salexigens]MBB4211231.1 glycosyltransferase involved in cell wall biosynthesis [Rhodothalassium salexigens DSM 2132]MBK1637680.1 hypothetical protein [Rhodothalassium salexigens DSM 2132]TCP35153.1 glycosyltransferase involved in cell wall biosynthesis [Rhodothalassium salexigens DSM 2132]
MSRENHKASFYDAHRSFPLKLPSALFQIFAYRRPAPYFTAGKNFGCRAAKDQSGMATRCILIIGPVNDAPNQIRFQRVFALAGAYRLDVVTPKPLPPSLEARAQAVHVVGKHLSLLRTSLQLARRLGHEDRVVVHTVYAPRLLLAGFLCRVLAQCRWVYDLYDHPSLTWSTSRGAGRVAKAGLWRLLLSPMLKLADVWIIGMHPGILSHLPMPKRECRLVMADGPGVRETSGPPPQWTSDREISLCYAGHISMRRGAGLIAEWARCYEGPPACLHLMGWETPDGVAALEAVRDEAMQHGLRLVRHGLIDHDAVLNIMRSCHIGLCPTDPDVLNYRYAYPVKVVEYLSQGLVPVATDGHGVRALLRHGENGFIARYDAASFSEAIAEAIHAVGNPDRRQELQVSMRASIKGRDWDTLNCRLLADIEAALSIAN